MEKALEREKQNRTISENAAKSKESAVGRQSSADGHTDAAGPEASKPDAQWAATGRRFKELTHLKIIWLYIDLNVFEPFRSVLLDIYLLG